MLVPIVLRGTLLYLLVFVSVGGTFYGISYTTEFWSVPVYPVYSGILSMVLGMGSMAYSLRKYYLKNLGSLSWWLNFHMVLGGMATITVLAHARLFFKAAIPSLAVFVMMIICIGGLYGWFLYRKVRTAIQKHQDQLSTDEIVLLSLAEGSMRYWRTVHISFTYILTALLTVHIISVYYIRGAY